MKSILKDLRNNFTRLQSFSNFFSEIDAADLNKSNADFAKNLEQYMNSDMFLAEFTENKDELLCLKKTLDTIVFDCSPQSIEKFAEWTIESQKEYLFILQTKNNVHLPTFLGLNKDHFSISADNNLCNFVVTYKPHPNFFEHIEKLGIKIDNNYIEKMKEPVNIKNINERNKQ